MEEDETQQLHTPPPGELRTRVPDAEIEELRDVRFSLAIRGYDRKQVDDYVTRVNRILAELQITAAPESAIRHALAEVSEETKSLLQGAQETADEITRRSQSRADELIQRAAQEAQELRDAAEEKARQLRESTANEAKEVSESAAREAHQVREAAKQESRQVREGAEARVRELEADAQAIAVERARLIDRLRELSRGLDAYLDDAEARHRDVQAADSPSQSDSDATRRQPAADG